MTSAVGLDELEKRYVEAQLAFAAHERDARTALLAPFAEPAAKPLTFFAALRRLLRAAFGLEPSVNARIAANNERYAAAAAAMERDAALWSKLRAQVEQAKHAYDVALAAHLRQRGVEQAKTALARLTAADTPKKGTNNG